MMKIVKIAVPVFVALFAGVLIGATPFAKDSLHFYLWNFVPITGLAIGGMLGVAQCRLSKLIGLGVGFPVSLIIGIAATGAYVATDVGRYLTTIVQPGESGPPVRLASIVSFKRYMELEYGAVEIGDVDGRRASNIKLDAHGHRVLHVIDLLLCFAVALGAASHFAWKWQFCDRCRKYMDQRHGDFTMLPSGDLTEERFVNRCEALAETGKLAELQIHLKTLESSDAGSLLPRARIGIEESSCGGCGETRSTLVKQVWTESPKIIAGWGDTKRWLVCSTTPGAANVDKKSEVS